MMKTKCVFACLFVLFLFLFLLRIDPLVNSYMERY